MPWKSARFARKTVVFTSRSRPLPASSRIAARFASTCSVCSPIVSPIISCPPGSSASWPDTNTSPPATIACEYGAPWKGAGACSVRTTVLSAIGLLSVPGHRAAQRRAKRLEDRLDDVLRLLAVDEADVERQAGRARKLVEEARDHVGADAPDAGGGQVDVRHDQRPPRGFEDDLGERLVGGGVTRAVADGPLVGERVRKRLAERAAARRGLRDRAAGSDLELEVEAPIAREQSEQVVEDGNPGRHRRLAGAGESDAHPGLSGFASGLGRGHGGYASTRSIWAPRCRRRSSIRS